ncbi:MAG: hypothetical protein JSS66_02580 [Armatimonadetes bacterium]|nr:hypothetical protein [Armatimonadota bacterium]
MERQRVLKLEISEEEAYELLLRCVSSEEDDNAAFRSALRKLAEGLRSQTTAA